MGAAWALALLIWIHENLWYAKPVGAACGCRHPSVGDSADPLRKRPGSAAGPAVTPRQDGSAWVFRRPSWVPAHHPWRVMAGPDAARQGARTRHDVVIYRDNPVALAIGLGL